MMTHRGFRKNVIDISESELDKYISDLTVKPVSFSDYNTETEEFPVYRMGTSTNGRSVENRYIYLPKYYARKNNLCCASGGTERVGGDIDLQFRGTLRDYQTGPCHEMLNVIETIDSGILCVQCGWGKTLASLWLISKIRKKTLIVIHKEFLMNQWVERIREFLPNARVGIIQQNKVDVENKDIVLAMLQSLTVRKESYPKETFDSFGFTVFDECHHICSQTFSKALFHVATKKSLGLSATPNRKDGLTKVLNWFLGDIVTHERVTQNIKTPSVKFVTSRYSKDKPPKVQYNYLGKVNLPNLITQIATDPERNKQITEEIVSLLAKAPRKILVLSERRKQCEILLDMLCQKGITSVGLYLGGMKQECLADTNTKSVILATYNMAAEGYDCSTLDTLFMVTSRSDIEQSVGRIMRKSNTNPPLIVDFVDNLEGLRGQTQRRKTYYRSKKYVLGELQVEAAETGFAFLEEP
jgi:superfamily II DNA or RNA helicase